MGRTNLRAGDVELGGNPALNPHPVLPKQPCLAAHTHETTTQAAHSSHALGKGKALASN